MPETVLFSLNFKIGNFPEIIREIDRQLGRGRGLSDTVFNDLPKAKITQEQVGEWCILTWPCWV